MFCFADVSRSLASLGQVSRTNSHHCCGTKASDQTPKQNHPVRPSGRRRNTRGFVCFGKRFDPQSCSATAVSGGDKWTINQRKAGFQWFQSGVLQRIKPYASSSHTSQLAVFSGNWSVQDVRFLHAFDRILIDVYGGMGSRDVPGSLDKNQVGE